MCTVQSKSPILHVRVTDNKRYSSCRKEETKLKNGHTIGSNLKDTWLCYMEQKKRGFIPPSGIKKMALSTFFPCGDTPPPAIFSGVRMANTGHVTQRTGARDSGLGARDLLVLGVRLSLPCVLCAHPASWAVSSSYRFVRSTESQYHRVHDRQVSRLHWVKTALLRGWTRQGLSTGAPSSGWSVAS
jgi:hypothetical protein